MEVNTTAVPAVPRTAATYKQHHLHSQSHKVHNQNHGNFPSKTILITITAVTSVTLLFAIFLLVLMLRRLKSTSKNRTCNDSSRVVLHDTCLGSVTSTALSFNSSPGNNKLVAYVIANSFLVVQQIQYMQT